MQYIVKHFDKCNNRWIDVSKPVDKEKAENLFNKLTNGGKKYVDPLSGDYFKIFQYDDGVTIKNYKKPKV